MSHTPNGDADGAPTPGLNARPVVGIGSVNGEIARLKSQNARLRTLLRAATGALRDVQTASATLPTLLGQLEDFAAWDRSGG